MVRVWRWKKQLIRTSCAIAAAGLPLLLLALPDGPEPRVTGAPGDSALACASAGCHTNSISGGPINDGAGSVNISFSSGETYTPGEPITVTVQVMDPINTLAGFQLTARLESDLANTQAGSFTPVPGQTIVICENSAIRFGQACPQGAPVEFIEHSVPRSDDWSFTWTPPAADQGPVHFYVAGNAVNNNGSDDGGDQVYTKESILHPATTQVCEDSIPSLTGAIVAGAFGGSETISGGNWVEIFGNNISTKTFREWLESDFNGTTAPTNLDGVGVSVNGRDAFVRFVGTMQVNVLTPEDTSTGPVNLTVTNCAGTSQALIVQKTDLSPGMLSFEIDEQQYIRGFNAVTASPLGAPGNPAKPGDPLLLFGIGFGPTNPAIAAGQIATQANSLANDLRIVIGGVELSSEQIGYAGLGPGFVGLYQFNLTVPQLPVGDHAVEISVGGVAVPQSLLLTIGQ